MIPERCEECQVNPDFRCCGPDGLPPESTYCARDMLAHFKYAHVRGEVWYGERITRAQADRISADGP